MTDLQRVSSDVMDWQLDMVVREEAYLDYTFPLEQMNGTNVTLVETLTVRHPALEVLAREVDRYASSAAKDR